MKEEEFDQFVRERIDSLNLIPDVQWDEEKVWKRIKSGKGFNPNVSFFMYGFLFFIITILVTFSLFLERPVNLIQKEVKLEPAKKVTDTELVSKALPLKEKPLINLSKEVSQLKDIAPTVEKESIQQFLGQKKSKPKYNMALKPDLKDEKKDSVKDVRSVPIKIAKVGDENNQHSIGQKVLKQKNQMALISDLTEEKKDSVNTHRFIPLNTLKVKNYREILFSIDPTSLNIGLNKITNLSRRFSLAYGLHLRKFYDSPDVFENSSEFSNNTSIEIPLQVRYQFPSNESKFSVFLYSELRNSLFLNQSNGIQNHNLKYRLGTELRYRFYRGYFFVRLPVYEKNLIN